MDHAVSEMYSERGNVIKIVDGFKFIHHKKLSNDTARYRCLKIACKAHLKIQDDKLTDCVLEHNHEADDYKKLHRQQVSNSVKRKAIDQPNERPSKLLETEDIAGMTKKDVAYVARVARRSRSKFKHKLSLDEDQEDDDLNSNTSMREPSDVESFQCSGIVMCTTQTMVGDKIETIDEQIGVVNLLPESQTLVREEEGGAQPTSSYPEQTPNLYPVLDQEADDSSSWTDDELGNKHFLLSLLPLMNRLSSEDNLAFRIETQKFLGVKLFPRPDDSS